MQAITGIPESATIGGIPLAAGGSVYEAAWMALDFSDVKRSLEKRGSDVLIPGVPGVVRNPRRPTVSRRLIPILILGAHDSDGNPHADPAAGVDLNLFEFQTLVVETTGLLPLVLSLRSMVLEGEVVVEDFTFGDVFDGSIRAVLEVSIADPLEETP
jgi:hypothetical protein